MRSGEKKTLTAELKNPFDQSIEGTAFLSSPTETWGAAGPHSLIDISPAKRHFKAAPGGVAKVAFEITAPPDAAHGSHLAMVKFVFEGNAVYTDTVRIRIVR